MSRFVYTTITNLSSNPASAQSAINANFAAVQTLVEDFVSRSGAPTNSMTSDLDMNSHKVLNLLAPTNPTDAVRLEDISSYLTSVQAVQANVNATYEQFQDNYLGPSANDPTQDADGESPATGALYFNTGSNVMKVYTGTVWATIVANTTSAQPISVLLTAIAALPGNGFITQLTATTVANRVITGTANKITITNGDGIAGNPTITIPASVQLVTPLLDTPTSGVLTNCTGYPTSALVGNLSLTTQVSGILPVANGGTNVNTPGITAFNNITGYTASGATGTTSTNLVFSTSPTFITPILGTPQSGNLSNCSNYPGSALTQVSDTNVTLTLGGSPTTALVNAASITAGWSGLLAIGRGGTGTTSGIASFIHAHFGGI